jgi:hypothetical protein
VRFSNFSINDTKLRMGELQLELHHMPLVRQRYDIRHGKLELAVEGELYNGNQNELHELTLTFNEVRYCKLNFRSHVTLTRVDVAEAAIPCVETEPVLLSFKKYVDPELAGEAGLTAHGTSNLYHLDFIWGADVIVDAAEVTATLLRRTLEP